MATDLFCVKEVRKAYVEVNVCTVHVQYFGGVIFGVGVILFLFDVYVWCGAVRCGADTANVYVSVACWSTDMSYEQNPSNCEYDELSLSHFVLYFVCCVAGLSPPTLFTSLSSSNSIFFSLLCAHFIHYFFRTK